jgi:hypothetical protein
VEALTQKTEEVTTKHTKDTKKERPKETKKQRTNCALPALAGSCSLFFVFLRVFRVFRGDLFFVTSAAG